MEVKIPGATVVELEDYWRERLFGTFGSNEDIVKRAIHMLTCAAAKGADILVLGAFGCGAFQNDPEVVARAYNTVLKEFP